MLQIKKTIAHILTRLKEYQTAFTTSGVYTYHKGAVYIDSNASPLYWKKSDGTYRNVMTLNGSNELVIGYGLYSNNETTTWIEGNEVRLLSKGDTKASFNGGTAYCVGTRTSMVTSSHTSSTATLNGNSSSGAKTQTFTKAGYYPLGIVGYQCNGSYGQYVVPSNVHISSQGSGTVTVSYTLKNTSSSQSTNTGITVYILWIKE